MTYSESESESDFREFESGSESDSESDFNSVFINLDICIFFCSICTLFYINFWMIFLSILIAESIVTQSMQV